MRMQNSMKFMNQRLFSFLNLSHASFNVPNTLAEIILCSVVASEGIYSVSFCPRRKEIMKKGGGKKYLVWMYLANPLHIINLDLIRHD